jgi:hypothetical protein
VALYNIVICAEPKQLEHGLEKGGDYEKIDRVPIRHIHPN